MAKENLLSLTLPSRAKVVFAAVIAVACGTAAADDADKAREDMQRALNDKVMAAPFNAGDIKKAQAYAEDAKKQGVVPVQQAPTYWAPGWTCGYLTSYQYYNYADYRNCVYYHHYYGRYWR